MELVWNLERISPKLKCAKKIELTETGTKTERLYPYAQNISR